MEGYDPAEAAQRSGIGVELNRSVELGILTPAADSRFTPGHLRRAALVKSLAASGIPLEGLGAVIRDGKVSLDFLDAPAFERFSALSGVTFDQLAERTGVPVELLMRIREATGSVAPQPDDRVRDEELACAEMLEAQVRAGFREAAILQLPARPGRQHGAHSRDGVGHVAVRGHRSRHGGRQTARRDPRGRPRRSD